MTDAEMMKKKLDERDSILIFTHELAKHLINNGFSIIDIKVNRDEPMRTVFVFKRNTEILKCIRQFSKIN